MLKLINKQRSIKNKMIFYYLIIFIPFLLMINFITYSVFSSNVENHIAERNQSTIAAISSEVEQTLMDMEMLSLLSFTHQFLMDNADPEDLMRQVESQQYLNQLFINVLSSKNHIVGINIYKDDRSIFRRQRQGLPLDYSYNYREDFWYEIAKSHKGLPAVLGSHQQNHLFLPRSISVIDRYVYSVAREINHIHTKETLGYIKIDEKLSSIENIINSYKIDNTLFFIVDDQSKIIYHPDYNLILRDVSEMMDEGSLSQPSKSFTRLYNNIEMLVSYSVSSYTNWTLVALTPLNVAKQEVFFIQKVIMITTIIGIVLSILISYMLSRSLSKPMEYLNNSMKKVAQGDLDFHLEPVSNDEIGNLTMSFNSMTKKLKAHIQQEYLERIKRQSAELKRNKAELLVLQRQINPHFLYNTLDSIRMTAALDGSKTVADMIYALSVFCRSNLFKNNETIALSEEIELMKNYIKIHQFRHPNRFKYVFNFSDDLLKLKIPHLILQPIIENAIQHGFERKKGTGTITVSATVNESLEIVVSDNGLGMPDEDIIKYNTLFKNNTLDIVSESENIGFLNVHQRLYKTYGHKYGLYLEPNKPEGLQVKVLLPVIEKI